MADKLDPKKLVDKFVAEGVRLWFTRGMMHLRIV